MQVEHLRDAVLRLDVVAAPGLRAVDELDLAALAHARHRAQALQLVLEAVLPLDRADEDAVLLAVIVRFSSHGSPESLSAFEPRQHLLLELRRPEAEALALLLVEERRAGARGQRAHPG